MSEQPLNQIMLTHPDPELIDSETAINARGWRGKALRQHLKPVRTVHRIDGEGWYRLSLFSLEAVIALERYLSPGEWYTNTSDVKALRQTGQPSARQQEALRKENIAAGLLYAEGADERAAVAAVEREARIEKGRKHNALQQSLAEIRRSGKARADAADAREAAAEKERKHKSLQCGIAKIRRIGRASRSRPKGTPEYHKMQGR